jgi:hypothetical protein
MKSEVCGINYTKRKNEQLFQTIKKEEIMDMEYIQNYIPIYSRFFNLTPTNYENVNLDNKWYLSEIRTKETNNIFNCVINTSGKESKTRTDNVFCKIVPLVDPYKYMVGKLFDKEEIFNIPTFVNNTDSHDALRDVNNNGYVDGLFAYFSNMLLNNNNFVHGINHYGSFIGVKRNMSVNIYDDIEYLSTSSFFNKHKNVDFSVEDYTHLLNEIIDNEDCVKLPPIIIHNNNTSENVLSLQDKPEDCSGLLQNINTLDDGIFEDIFESSLESSNISNENTLTLNDLADTDLEIIDVVTSGDTMKLDNKSICSSSSCSSRTSHTSSFNSNDDESCDNSDETEWSDESSSDESDEILTAVIPRFPVELIFMEKLEYTLDTIMMDDEDKLNDEEWLSILMQVIMTLIVYQNIFSFTHNDLHTNNIMFVNTNKQFLYYKYQGVYYKVPTFGRIAKIIDFGRSIYKYNGVVMCSDSFKPGEDAATQYNTEPYFNPSKPRLEPNMSFDLCRLACSIYDELIEDPDDIGDSVVAKIINEWCTDDSGRNVMYKKNGDERYPSFKLYKMISRIVHNHTPDNQLQRPEFSQYSISKSQIGNKVMKHVMNIDSMPNLKNASS